MGSATSIIRLSLESNQYEQGIRGAKKRFEDFTASIGINMKKMTAFGLAAGAAASAINSLAGSISTAFTEGTRMAKELEGVKSAFRRLDNPGLLDNLREATHGTVNDLELMKQAVKFDNFNLSLDQMGTMLAFAQQQAKDTGQDVGYLVDSIVTGLGRKSLPILDNLGLSATEIRERMKETGDMTEAVAQIIQERMNAAGGYVETASDRAAKATADLENAMTSLGETFSPLIGASDSLWTSIKIGAINALNTAVKPLIQALSEAGILGQGARSKAGFNNLGGNSKVDRMIGRLGNGKSQGAYSIYQQQLGEFDKYINKKRFQIASYDGDNSGVAQSAKARLQTELDGALRMREEYVRRAKELHDKVPSPVSAPTADGSGNTGGKGGNTTITNEVTYASDSIVAQQKLVQELTKKWNEAGADVRDQYVKPLVEAEAKLRDMQNAQGLAKEQAQGKLLGNTPDGKAVEIPISSDIAFETWMAGVQEKLAGLKLEPIEIPIETAGDNVKDIAKAASITADVVGSIGDAFNAIEDPAAKVAGTVMQAIASVALGYAQATTSAAKLGPWAWIAFAATGLATMISTISAIHSSTGYANGGMVKGNSYSGDNIPAIVDGSELVGLNAGEVVLNAAQQNSLAQNLSGNLRSIHVVGKISGTDIILSADRTLMTQGKQLAVWGR